MSRSSCVIVGVLAAACLFGACAEKPASVEPTVGSFESPRDQGPVAAECYDAVLTHLVYETGAGVVVPNISFPGIERTARSMRERVANEPGIRDRELALELCDQLVRASEVGTQRVEVTAHPDDLRPIYSTDDTRPGHRRGLSYLDPELLAERYPDAPTVVRFSPVALADDETHAAVLALLSSSPKDGSRVLYLLRKSGPTWALDAQLQLWSADDR